MTFNLTTELFETQSQAVSRFRPGQKLCHPACGTDKIISNSRRNNGPGRFVNRFTDRNRERHTDVDFFFSYCDCFKNARTRNQDRYEFNAFSVQGTWKDVSILEGGFPVNDHILNSFNDFPMEFDPTTDLLPFEKE